MNFELSESENQIKSWAAAVAKDLISPTAELKSGKKIPESLLISLAKDGWNSLVVPSELGGGGLSPYEFSLAIREVAKVSGSVAVTLAVTNMIADLLVREGAAFHHQKFISRLTSGEALAASFCFTENQAGSDAGSLASTAKREGDFYILNGEKIYVTNGAFADFFVVMARTGEGLGNKGISAFVVSKTTEGLSLGKEEDKMGLESSSTITVHLKNVKVPLSHRLLEEGDGFKIALRTLDGGRISVASQALGIAEAALEAGIRYAKEREQFGKPIADFQAIQWKLADASTELSAADLLIRKAANLKAQKKAFTTEASMAKVWTTETAVKVADQMIQIFGGYGYIKEYPVEKYFRDVRVTTLYEGTSEIQRLVIARSLLGGGK